VGTDLLFANVEPLIESGQTAECRERDGDVARRALIAVVADDPNTRSWLARLLSVFGYGVELFASAEEFQSAAPKSKATCLLVDFHLGDLSVRDLARWLAAAGDLPIISFPAHRQSRRPLPA
jgi:FixJ family two-component response regulator